MPFDGSAPRQTRLRPPRDRLALARAERTGALCPEVAMVLTEWTFLDDIPTTPPSPPHTPTRRDDPKERARWREAFTRWYLWHSSLRPKPPSTTSIADALAAAQAAAEPHIQTARDLLDKLRTTGRLAPTDIPVLFDPLAEEKYEALRKKLEHQNRRKLANAERLELLEQEGGFFRSLRSPALMRFVQCLHRPPLLAGGTDKEKIFPPFTKMDGLDLPYVEANKLYRSILRVDIDTHFLSLDDLTQRLANTGVPLPNIVSWFVADTRSEHAADTIPRPHLIWLLDRPVWWKEGHRYAELWQNVLRRLTTALIPLGADPNGMLNPMRLKNPLGIDSGWAVLDDLPWSLADLANALPKDDIAPTPPVLDLDSQSQSVFRRVSTFANTRARELITVADGRHRLEDEVRTLHEDLLRLRHGPLSQKQLEACQRASAKMAAFAWALAERRFPTRTPRRPKGKTAAAKAAAARLQGHSTGGLTRTARYRERLATVLPDAIEACWYNERVPISAKRLSQYVAAKADTLRHHWDIIMDICQRKNIPIRQSTILSHERLRHHYAARRQHTQDKILAYEKGWLAPPERRPPTRKGPISRSRAAALRTRRKTWRVAGLAIGRPRTGDVTLNDLQACIDDIVARAGGANARLGPTHSRTLLRELDIHINSIKAANTPLCASPIQALTRKVFHQRWLDICRTPKTWRQALRHFPRVPQHMLARALIHQTQTTTSQRPNTPSA